MVLKNNNNKKFKGIVTLILTCKLYYNTIWLEVSKGIPYIYDLLYEYYDINIWCRKVVEALLCFTIKFSFKEIRQREDKGRCLFLYLFLNSLEQEESLLFM